MYNKQGWGRGGGEGGGGGGRGGRGEGGGGVLMYCVGCQSPKLSATEYRVKSRVQGEDLPLKECQESTLKVPCKGDGYKKKRSCYW